MRTLVLASTSTFRKTLLEKLNIPFICAKPEVDESPYDGEQPKDLVERLAIAKAKKIAKQFPDALVIGSDQVAYCHNKILGKPHHFDNAVNQLTSFSGQCITFYTGLCVYDSKSDKYTSLVELFKVYFNQLSQQEITQYLHAEQPYQCAGSFKSEGLGICLFDRLEGEDPNSLIGLPLIKLNKLLQQHDFNILSLQNSPLP